MNRAYTLLGQCPNCPHCERQVHSKGMIGGGWRVDGKGGPELILDVQARPGVKPDNAIDNPRTRIVIDREGRVVEVTTR